MNAAAAAEQSQRNASLDSWEISPIEARLTFRFHDVMHKIEHATQRGRRSRLFLRVACPPAFRTALEEDGFEVKAGILFVSVRW